MNSGQRLTSLNASQTFNREQLMFTLPRSDDNQYMARALRLAERGLYTTMPNPLVGCVLVKADKVVGEGWHLRAGEGHAEVNALAAAGTGAKGATAYVTLEPCSHTGKTGPCAQALIDAGIERVVYGMEDPNPLVAGRGLDLLDAAGIEVSGALMEESARALNRGFIHRMQSGLPRVTSKSAMSLDGRTAMASGESKWITNPKARADVQRLRARSCALITGVDTILFDHPQYTVRAAELGLAAEEARLAAAKQPLRVIVDSSLRLPQKSLILQGGGRILLVHNNADAALCEGWPDRVELLSLPGKGLHEGRVDLLALLKELAKRECNEVLLEAGATLSGGFMRRGLVDELVVYLAATLMGSAARPLFELPLDTMAGKLELKITDVRAVGDDWKITAVPDKEA